MGLLSYSTFVGVGVGMEEGAMHSHCRLLTDYSSTASYPLPTYSLSGGSWFSRKTLLAHSHEKRSSLVLICTLCPCTHMG